VHEINPTCIYKAAAELNVRSGVSVTELKFTARPALVVV